ncbi:serine hydrolase domain-containing protein [Nocardioides sp.]|uniref:serine hydrolase domain-containing protein n=1 Tax=Nocardioides sp. TaxID=35761 RepID=UPI002ED67C29
MTTALPDQTVRSLRRTALDRQRTGRVPGLYAAVHRRGDVLWADGIGVVEVGAQRSPGPDDQFLIASNSKTFTAVMVMQLRDEGRLSLDDRIADHLSEITHPTTVRQGLAHVSGLQREPVGNVWETLQQPTTEELLRGFADVEAVGRPHDRWHYSNVVYAVLGELVARLDGRSWEDSLRVRLLEPLELRRTSVGFDDGARATGYYVAPYDDVPRPEPVIDLHAMAPCGGLASTARDLVRWSAFVADPDPGVLSPDTMEEMCQPQALRDVDGWTGAMGLGFFLARSSAGRTWVGHTGGMPGHITGVFTHRESGTGALVLMNASVTPAPDLFAVELGDRVVADVPDEPEPWSPGTELPEELAGLRGVWFLEGSPFVFSVVHGRLEARPQGAPAASPPSVFEKVGEDRYRTVSGRERGELLLVTRDDSGVPTKLNWATYRATREPLAFGESPG